MYGMGWDSSTVLAAVKSERSNNEFTKDEAWCTKSTFCNPLLGLHFLKENMKKSIIYSTMGVLGTITIGSIAAFTIFYNKYKDNSKALEGINEKKKFVTITMIPDSDVTHTVTKVYDVQENEKTLEDLLLHHSSDFALAPNTGFGRYLTTVFGIEAHSTSNQYWSLGSPSYISHHPSAIDIDNPHGVQEGYLNVGVSGIQLTFSEYFNLKLTNY